jgi:hypothetical protein
LSTFHLRRTGSTTSRVPGRSYPKLESLENRELLAADFHRLPVIPLIDSSMQSRLQSVYRLGQLLGERPNVFMKVGDSNSTLPGYLDPFGSSAYEPQTADFFGFSPGAFSSIIDYFRATPIDPAGLNSFNHMSAATYYGWNTTDVLTPGERGFAPWPNINPGDSPLQAEIDQTKPAIALVMIGTAEIQFQNTTQYQANLTTIALTLLSQGIIPVLSTIPEIEFADSTLPSRVSQYNQIIANVADELNVPLWNLWVGLAPLPSLGIGADQVHLSVSPNGDSQTGAADIVFGVNYRNLTALATLNKLVSIVELNGTPDQTPPYLPPGIAPAAFISAIYQSALQRPADAEGQAQFGLQFADGVSASVVIQELWLSPEHREKQITQCYSAYLHRAPDTDGLAWWSQQFAQGLTENEVKAGILTSSEYVDNHTSSSSYIEKLYQNLLNRAAGQSEVAVWASFLQLGHSMRELCTSIIQSSEAQALVIDGYYESFLERSADNQGTLVGLALLDNSTNGDLWVVQMLLTSAEYMTRV